MRILGLDFGSKTCGVAVSDPLGLTAQGVEIIRRDKENHMRKTYRRIGELVEEYKAEAFVVGLPFNMDDTEGERAQKSRLFGAELGKRFHLPVHFQDERLTTVEADDIMDEAGISRMDHKRYVDKIAAMIILQDWLNQYGTDNFHG